MKHARFWVSVGLIVVGAFIAAFAPHPAAFHVASGHRDPRFLASAEAPAVPLMDTLEMADSLQGSPGRSLGNRPREPILPPGATDRQNKRNRSSTVRKRNAPGRLAVSLITVRGRRRSPRRMKPRRSRYGFSSSAQGLGRGALAVQTLRRYRKSTPRWKASWG